MDNRRRNSPGLEDYGQCFMKIQFTQINVNTNLMPLYEERIAPFIWTFINGCFKIWMLCSMVEKLLHLFGLS